MDNKNIEDLIGYIYSNPGKYTYKDIKELMKNAKTFNDQSNLIIAEVIDSFKSEEKYTVDYRLIFSKLITTFMIINFVVIIGMSIYAVIDKAVNIAVIITVLVSLIAETVGLLAIIFKYLFNREQNKVLDVMVEYLKVKSKHETDINNFEIPFDFDPDDYDFDDEDDDDEDDDGEDDDDEDDEDQNIY